MMVKVKDALFEGEKEQIFSIWNAVYPSEVVGWLMSFDRHGARSFVMLVAESMQHTGVGRALLERMMDMETEVEAWAVASSGYRKLDGTPYRSPLGFYRRFGFSILDEKRTQGDFETTKIAWHKTP